MKDSAALIIDDESRAVCRRQLLMRSPLFSIAKD
jgi:hypothetical protein